MIQTINFTITTSCQDENFGSPNPIDLHRLDIFLEDCDCRYLLYGLPFGGVYFQCFVRAARN